jgi:sulfatase maturation enzyme AslB (radical SAM superfamily)
MLASILGIEFNSNKHLVHWDKIQALVKGKDIFPVTLELDVSSACDHDCTWCVDPAGSHSNVLMPASMARKILREAKLLGIQGIVFKGGGESTLNPELASILQTAGDLEFEIGIVTHGGNLEDETLLNALVRYGAYVRLSIDGPTPESRQELHGVDDFNTLVTGIENLVAMRGSKRHPVIGANFCLDYARRHLAETCIHLGEKLGLDYVLIRPPFCEEVGFPAPHTPAEAALLRKELQNAAESYSGKMPVMVGNWVGDKEMETLAREKKIKQIPRRDQVLYRFKYNGIEHVSKRCLASPLLLVVTAEGEVYGCCCLRGIKTFSFGKINYSEGISLRVIMESEQRQQRLKRMRQVECLGHCTHPLEKINALIEYLSLPHKYHSSFI